MPEAFVKCVREGGRVRTIKGPNGEFGLKAGEHMRVCFRGDRMFRGEKKRTKARG